MTKQERGEKWDKEFISCKFHPSRRCNRSRYVGSREARCAGCNRSRIDGTPKPGLTRYYKSEQKYWAARAASRLRRIKENRP